MILIDINIVTFLMSQYLKMKIVTSICNTFNYYRINSCIHAVLMDFVLSEAVTPGQFDYLRRRRFPQSPKVDTALLQCAASPGRSADQTNCFDEKPAALWGAGGSSGVCRRSAHIW